MTAENPIDSVRSVSVLVGDLYCIVWTLSATPPPPPLPPLPQWTCTGQDKGRWAVDTGDWLTGINCWKYTPLNLPNWYSGAMADIGGGGGRGEVGGSLVFLIWACYVIRVSRLAEVHTMSLVQLHAPLQLINSVQIIVSTM